MIKGEIVLARGFDNELAACRLFEIQGSVALVCSESEWRDAQREKRDPECLGWPLSHVRQGEAMKPKGQP